MTLGDGDARVDIEAIRQFLYHEAHLLDSWQLEEWLALFADELTYWIPVRHACTDPDLEVQHAYDDRQRLGERVERLGGRHAFAQQPRSRLSRIIANVSVLEHRADDIVVRSTFLLSELRRGVTDQWAGTLVHRLRPAVEGQPYRIATKKVLLLASEEPIDNLTFLL